MTTTIEVKAVSPTNPQVTDTTTIEVELLANAAGRIIMDHDHAMVELVDLCGMEDRIVERTMVCRPRDGALWGEATPKGRGKQKAGLKIADRPDHSALYHACVAINARVEDVRKEMWAARVAEAEAVTRSRAPEGHVAVTFSHSEGDGWIDVWTDADGRELRSPRIAERHGRAGWMTPEDHRDAVASAESASAARVAREDVSAPVVAIPVAAEAAYRRYGGIAEKAWEAEDERAWGLIREYYPET